MRVLFVAATAVEVESLKLKVESNEPADSFKPSSLNVAATATKVESNEPADSFKPLTLNFKLLITGVGMVATAYALGRELTANQYDLAINLGIAGSFDRNIALGEVIEITEDTLTELGAEDNEAFLPVDQLGFGESTFKATRSVTSLFNAINLRQATAITVNTVHGNSASIQKLQQRVNPQLESMEGAAFFYVCREAGVPCLQIRAVSNYVEKRNRDNWQIGLAIKNLNNFAEDLLRVLGSEGPA